MITFMLFPRFTPQSTDMQATTAGERRWGVIMRSVFLALLTTSLFAMGARVIFYGLPDGVAVLFSKDSQVATAAAAVTSPFSYTFDVRGTLEETGSPGESSSPYWWLDSGARLYIDNGMGTTVQGALPMLDEWRLKYRLSSADDTEGGYAPQNLFRLLTRSTWDDVRVEADFRIVRDNFSETPSRNESNGLLLMTRYKDAANLYYAGVRVDGHAVIKKKSGGTYHTMAEKQVFGAASTTYDRTKDMNLLPHNEWISLRSETLTRNNGDVLVKLLMKKEGEAKWTELLRATDDGTKYASTTPITGAYPIGIRTDFMDVEFDNFRAEKI
jgi:hypothetical protein